MRHPLLELELANDRDMIAARQRARQVSALLDFDAQDQVDKQREELITAIEGKLQQKKSTNPLFVLRWTLS